MITSTLNPQQKAVTAPTPEKPAEGFSGRDRFLSNVLWSWAGHLVFIVAGFIMPRFIDHNLGQTNLGIWDFGWSIVSYFGLAQIGIGASVNRYVAKHRAVGDVAALRRTVTSVNCFQAVAAGCILMVAALIVLRFDALFGTTLGSHSSDARWVLALLGCALAVETAFDAFRGVITGCHRWDLHNGINSGSQAVTTLAMMLGISLGGGLPMMAAIYLAGGIGAEIVRVVTARRVCPELTFELRDFSMAEVRTLVSFGGKSLIEGYARLTLYQANSILVVWHYGAALLAVYARGQALARHAELLTNKLSYVISPAASSLKSSGRPEELRELFLSGTRYGAFVALPLVMFLAIIGESLIKVWMGSNYEAPWVVPVLALGQVMPLVARPGQHVLIGLNMHGRLSIASLITAFVGLGTSYALLQYTNLGLMGAALGVSVPASIGNGLFVSAYACRVLDVSVTRYVRAFAQPATCTLLFGVALLIARLASGDDPLTTLIVGTVLGGLVMAPCYWVYALPDRVRQRIMAALPVRVAQLGRLRGEATGK